MATEEQEITVEIGCVQLSGSKAAGLSLGIQKGQEVVEITSTDQQRIVFRPDFRVRPNPDGSVNFLGPFAHGPKQERFIYLSWLVMLGKLPVSSPGRVKLHLNHIKWEHVEKALARRKPIKVTVSLTAEGGKPVFASVRPGAAHWEL